MKKILLLPLLLLALPVFADNAPATTGPNLDHMQTRFEATVDRLQNISDRLNMRIIKIHANGTATSSADQLMKKAKTDLDNAHTDLKSIKTETEKIKGMFASTTGTSTPKVSFTRLILLSDIMQKHMGNAKESLFKVIERLQATTSTSTKPTI